jgi:hypothetical protein
MKARDGKVNVQVCRVSVGTCFGRFSSSSCFNGEYRKESGSWTGELRPSLKPNERLQRTGISVPLIDNLSGMQLSAGR